MSFLAALDSAPGLDLDGASGTLEECLPYPPIDETNRASNSILGPPKPADKKVVREFVSDRPMFFTSDLDHHFKYDDIIEVTSVAQSRTYILTANFYFTEIEAFRTTTSRDFIQPPDEGSKPFSDETFEAPAEKRTTQQPPPSRPPETKT